ncbi:LysE family translocator [Rhizobium esperanzae]|uniref:RhtB (Resistance to homoserine/threonine) family protein n=1 Tax=Rhizobium esperanzae TaxID=1967781 RepID=A0A7W6W392_9HYPH|nr:LysE family transporter [Rhizobium esperanzae]MBB4234163.1 RhtB (resistance to homoserine/threonine) family protein [Rhizobium esperanzae]
MEYIDSLALLVSVYVASLVSPGPNFIIVTSTSMTASRAAGLFAGLGLAIASLTWAVMAMAGLGFLLTHFEWLHITLQVAGALYLIWLGLKMIRGAAKPLKATGPTDVAWRSAMRRAYVVSMTNPKSVAFFGSIFALVIPTHAPIWLYCVIALTCFLLSALWYCGLAFFFSNPRVSAGFLRFKASIERVMGATLILIGGRLLWAR